MTTDYLPPAWMCLMMEKKDSLPQEEYREWLQSKEAQVIPEQVRQGEIWVNTTTEKRC